MSIDSSAFADHVLELMADLPDVSARRMFGAQGIFREGLMFALMAEGTLYLKTDEETEAEFEERDLPSFIVMRKDRQMVTSYRPCPEEAMEKSSAMTRWATVAWEAAVREDEKKSASKRKRQAG